MRSAVLAPTFLRAWLLALVLVASQAAGLAHRIVHAGGANGAKVATASATVGGFWNASHDRGSADCRLIDQLAHADVLCAAPVLPLPLLPAADTAVAAVATPLLAATATAYFARGPPALQLA